MTPEQAKQAVSDQSRARFLWASGKPSGVEGRVVAYSNEPQVLIETDDGERAWWRADLSERIQ